MHAAISCSYSEYEFMELKNVYIANVYMGLCGNLISIHVLICGWIGGIFNVFINIVPFLEEEVYREFCVIVLIIY